MESTACLVRSYSNPSSPSPETKQGDPYRCLTSSKSFGRYMTGSLNWEKWSAFTENRNMEDVKKYSRPGSVAQMKAYFEAHYKKKADERAAALLEQPNVVYRSNVEQGLMQMDNHVARGETCEDEAARNMVSYSVDVSRCNPPNVELGSMQMDNHVARGETCEEEAARNMVSYSVDVSRCNPPSGEGRAEEGAQFVEAEENQSVDKVEDVRESGCSENINGREQVSLQLVKVEKSLTSDQVDVCGHFESIEDNGKGVCGEDNKKTRRKANGELGDPASLCKSKPSPFKSRGRIGVPKPPAPPKPLVPIRKRQNRKANPGSKENEADLDNKTSATRPLHMSIDLAPKQTNKPMSQILQRFFGAPKPPAPPKLSVPIRKMQNRKANTGSTENAADVENKKSAIRTLDLCIDLAPKQTKKPMSPILQRLVNPGSRENAADVENKKSATRSLDMSIDLAPKQTKKPMSPVLQRLVNSRLGKTLAGRQLQDTVNIPAHPPVSLQPKKISSSKSPRACIRNVQSPTVSCPFSFKSEERVAKRKEFFERLEQNAKANIAEKLQQQSKVKARNDFKYMHLSATSKVVPCSDSSRTRRTPSDTSTSKAIPAVSCSPFVSGEETLKDNTNRPPWRPTSGCKEVRGKNKQLAAYPLKSVSKKYTSENASPNIRLC